VRHEPGKIHYTFDEHKAPVSALALSSDEKSVFSASHDSLALVSKLLGSILMLSDSFFMQQLDLDRGVVARRFEHPGAQITALGLRPYYPFTLPEPSTALVKMSPENEEVESKPIHQDESIEMQPEDDSMAVPLATSPNDLDNKSDAYDPLFDDVDGNTVSVQPSPNTSQPPSSNALGLALPGRSRTASLADQTWPGTQSAPAMKHGVGLLDPVKYSDYSSDILMTATFGGSLFLWDRRVQGKVGRIENDRTPPWSISVSICVTCRLRRYSAPYNRPVGLPLGMRS
jgi:transcriptional activator SPT8